jgi:hypothetical protein
MNTSVTQGSIGLTAAIYKLTQIGYNIALPILDNQEYDLIAGYEGLLYKVEVKSSSVKALSGNWTVQIKKVRSNKSVNAITNFDNSLVDYLFVYTMDGDCYFIPSECIDTKTTITIPGKYSSYKI